MTIQNGQAVELILRPGVDGERTVKGTVHRFQTEPRFDPATGKQLVYSEDRWEVLTGDPAYPAVGFDPETAEFK